MADAERMTIASADDNARRATLPSNDSEKAQPWQPIPVENSPFHQEPGMWSGQRHSRHLPIRPSITLVTGGLGGSRYGASTEIGQRLQTQNSASPPGLGTVQNRGSQLSTCCEFPGILRPRDRRIHRLVLLGTTIGLQPDRCFGIDFPGAEQPRSLHHQCAVDRRPPACVRGR